MNYRHSIKILIIEVPSRKDQINQPVKWFYIGFKVNRLEKIVASLKKERIDVDNPDIVSVLVRLAQSDRNLEIGSVSTALASTYENVRDSASTETKFCISDEIQMKVNGFVVRCSIHSECS